MKFWMLSISIDISRTSIKSASISIWHIKQYFPVFRYWSIIHCFDPTLKRSFKNHYTLFLKEKTTDILACKAFFDRNGKLFGLGRKIGQTNFGAFGGMFGWPIITHFGTVSPISKFFIKHLFFLQEIKPLQIPNIYLGLGFEFEFRPQRIRDLAIVCPRCLWAILTKITYEVEPPLNRLFCSRIQCRFAKFLMHTFTILHKCNIANIEEIDWKIQIQYWFQHHR